MKINKWLATALTLAVFAGTTAAPAAAPIASLTASAADYEEFTEAGCTYRVYDDHAELTQGSNATRVTIAESIGGKPVTVIGNSAFSNSANLMTVTIPDSVTTIGSGAFLNCKNLMSVTFGNGVTSIENSAFEYCTSLETVTIPDNVQTIGSQVFYECTTLSAVTLPEGLTTISSYAFADCAALTAVTLPESLTSLGVGAFISTGLKSIILPKNLTSADTDALRGCKALESIEINGLTAIPSSFAADCPALTKVKINTVITEVGSYAFSGNKSLTGFTYTGRNTVFKNSAFEGCPLTSFDFENANKIESAAFIDCPLTEITLPRSVTEVGSDAFWNTALTSVTILNPECVIAQDEGTFLPKSDGNGTTKPVIYGYDYSSAMLYAKNYNYTFVSFGEAPEDTTEVLGDVSGNGKVDATDAADLLIALAKIGAGLDSGLTDAQRTAADTDGSGELNAADAAVILQYAAYTGAGGTGSLADFLAR